MQAHAKRDLYDTSWADLWISRDSRGFSRDVDSKNSEHAKIWDWARGALARSSRARAELEGSSRYSRGLELAKSGFWKIALLGFFCLFKAQHTSQDLYFWAASIENSLRKVFSLLLNAQKQVLAKIFFNHIEEIKSLEEVQDLKSVLRGSERWSNTETVNRGYEQDSDNH